MQTNNQIVTKALQELKLVASGEAADSQDASDMLGILNSMMAEWEENSLNFNWFPQSVLSDTCPIPVWSESGIISNLAVYAAPDMAAQVTELVAIKASRGLNTIATTLINQQIKSNNMTHVPLGYAYDVNIVTDN